MEHRSGRLKLSISRTVYVTEPKTPKPLAARGYLVPPSAPWLDPARIPVSLRRGPGYTLREVAFQPTFHKYAGEVVRGFQLHPTDAERFRPVAAATAFLAAVRRAHPDRFAWSDPPYEYEYDRLPIDLIAGTDAVRLAVDQGTDAEALAASWRAEEEAFRTARRPFLLYGAGAA